MKRLFHPFVLACAFVFALASCELTPYAGQDSKQEKKKLKKKLQICYGISQSYISRLEKKIMNKMKKDIISKTG